MERCCNFIYACFVILDGVVVSFVEDASEADGLLGEGGGHRAISADGFVEGTGAVVIK